MATKVQHALAWVQALPGLQVRIFSAQEPASLSAALRGETLGTLVCA
jgi:isopentenyl phosphate kinase